MKKDPLVLLDDILESVQAVRRYVSDMQFDVFMEDGKTQDAVIRRFEVMGEAANRLPESFREAHADIPWRKIIGMRNVLAHEYDDIAMEILWDTIANQLAPLETSIRSILEAAD